MCNFISKIKFKGASLQVFSFLFFFLTFFFFLTLRFWYHKKAHIYLTCPWEINRWNMLCLKDVVKNVTNYGNHKLTQWGTGNCSKTNLLCTSIQIDWFNWNLKFISMEWLFFKQSMKFHFISFWKIRPCTFNNTLIKQKQKNIFWEWKMGFPNHQNLLFCNWALLTLKNTSTASDHK